MNIYLTAKVSAIADAVVALTSAMLSEPLKHRVMIIRHTHNGQPLLEFRVLDALTPAGMSMDPYGVRQAWVYTYPKEKQAEIHYTTRQDIERIVREYPSMQNVPSIAFSTAKRTTKPYELVNLAALCEILLVYLSTGPDDNPEGILPNIEDGLPEREA